jgi:hypothetical protein
MGGSDGDSVVIEAPAGTSQTGVGPECVAAAQAALSKTFNGLQPVLGFGVGLTWGDAAIALDAQLVARNQPEPVPAEPADLYPHLKQRCPAIPACCPTGPADLPVEWSPRSRNADRVFLLTAAK